MIVLRMLGDQLITDRWYCQLYLDPKNSCGAERGSRFTNDEFDSLPTPDWEYISEDIDR